MLDPHLPRAWRSEMMEDPRRRQCYGGLLSVHLGRRPATRPQDWSMWDRLLRAFCNRFIAKATSNTVRLQYPHTWLCRIVNRVEDRWQADPIALNIALRAAPRLGLRIKRGSSTVVGAVPYARNRLSNASESHGRQLPGTYLARYHRTALLGPGAVWGVAHPDQGDLIDR